MEVESDGGSQPMEVDDIGEERGEKEKTLTVDNCDVSEAPGSSRGRRSLAEDCDYLHQIQDEICLEGLDGVTLQGLWLRLANRPGYSLGLTEDAKEFIWEVVLSLEEVSLYKLQEPRADLVLHDRYQHMDGDLGIVIEPEVLPQDIYPYQLVENHPQGIKGSCSTFSSREEVSKELSLAEAKEMAGSLVMVGSQMARTEALVGEDWDPLQVAAITDTQWAILERVGRARYHGEVTQGKLSLQAMKVDPKTLFYHRKSLVRNGLILKQVHHQKSRGQNFQGTLFHLPRFYVERKPKALVLVRNAIVFLKTRENGIATYDDVRNHLNLGNSVKKLFKTHDFQRFMKGDVRVPFRDLYPDAHESEWKRKGTNHEKSVRVVKLLDLSVNPDNVFKDDEDTSRAQEDSDSNSKSLAGLLDQSQWLADRSMMWQAYAKVEEAGPEGLSQQQLGQRLGQGKLEARTICRNLQRRGLVVTIMKDIGRQRVTNFVAKKFEKVSHGASQYSIEKEKNDQLTGNIQLDTAPESLLKIELSEQTAAAEDDNDADNEDEETDTQESGTMTPRRGEEDDDYRMSRSLVSSPTKSLDGQQQVNIIEKSEGSNMEISITSGFVLPEDNSPKKKVKRREEVKAETYRQLKRRNMIMEAVRQHGVIDDPTKLYKMIQESEAKEGQSAKMDKKSLMRLISKLGKEGQIHNIRCVFRDGDRKKILHFVCEPGIDETNTVIQSAIEQAKMKFNIHSRPEPRDSEFLSDSISESLAEIAELEDSSQSGEAGQGGTSSSIRYGRKYGLQPKFVKMRELHLLLYYLIYGYSGDPDLDQAATRAQLQSSGVITEEVVEEMTGQHLYSSSVSWKMFIPPLPAHQGWGLGWCLMCDVLLRLPLSVFVKLVNITQEIPGLQEYLNHPVRRNYLIRTLPHSIRNKLLTQRKYIFSVHEVASRLAYIGVLQFGPQKLKEKDQVFLYINRQASILDTTSSSPGYHQVERDVQYPQETYNLTSLEAVEQFWHRLWEVCIFTPLGGSSALSGQEITVEVMERKPAMLASLAPRTADNAPEHDDGSIPGDGLGAAGLDSSIFAHLKRNWTWNSSANYRKGDKLTSPPFMMSGPRNRNKVVTVNTTLGRTKVAVSKQANVKKSTKGQKRKRANSESSKQAGKESSDKEVSSIKFKSRRPSVFTRVVGRKKSRAERKPYYDEKDKAALRLMRKLRVDWSAGEDSFLLLCKVAGSYLCMTARYQMVPYTAVRDLLHEHFPESQNKTSRACQRRLNYMLKNQSTADNVALFLEDVKQDEKIVSKFSIPEAGALSKSNNEARLDRDFKPLVEILMLKYKDDAKRASNRPQLPSTKAEIEEEYTLVFPENTQSKKWRFSEATTVSDVQASVVNALITSSLCSANDKRSWAYQLFKIYQQYPDSLLRGVMATLRSNKMVSLKKHYNKTKLKEGNYLPLSSAPYQLSVTFSHIFLCRYQYDIYSQSWQLARKLLDSNIGQEEFTEIICQQEGGFAATVLGLMSANRIKFRTEVPDQLVVLDPNMAAVDENYVRILQRYKELLKNAGSMEDSDLEAMRSPTKPITSTALFSRDDRGLTPTDSEASDRCSQERELGEREKSSKTLKFGKSGNENQIIFQEGDGDGDARSNTTLAKSASRIALYMMREEMKESPLESNPVQHSHDFFVISSCSVFAKLLKPEVESEKVNFNGLHIDKNSLPGDYDACRTVLSRFALDVNGRSGRGTQLGDFPVRRNVIPFKVDLEQVKQICVEEGWTDNDLLSLEKFCSFIDSFGFQGATKEDIRQFQTSGVKVLPVEKILEQALTHFLVIEVGIASQRFVSHQNSTEWLLHSFKMKKTSEEVGSVKFAGKLYQGHGSLSPEEDEQNPDSGQPQTSSGRSRRIIRKGSLDNNSGGEDIGVNALRKNPGVGVRMSREVKEACEKINWGKVEEILVAMKPWIRVDGTLNRRVLDRLLGAMLGVIMQTPGQTLATLSQRFSPAVQPAHCREVVTILADLHCVSLVKMSRPQPVSLFSKPLRTVFSEASMLDSDDQLLVEAEVDAIIKLGMFIGDKVYTTDFASQCPCHPDRRM